MLKQVQMISIHRACQIISKMRKPKHITKLSQLTNSKRICQHTIPLYVSLKPVTSMRYYDTM